MSEVKVKTAVIGASGYSGAELLRLLLMHPNAELVGVTSREHAGKSLTEVYPRFRQAPGAKGLAFIAPDPEAVEATGAEIVFLALPHGVAADYATSLLERGLRIVDLSADFRLRSPEVYKTYYGQEHPAPQLLAEAVYGLPEVYGEQIKEARLVASPGCYPTSILVPLIPLLKAGLIAKSGIAVASMSGASGAGKKADTSLLFGEINESVRAYGAPRHRHLGEIEQELTLAAGGSEVQISFVPHLMPVTAGIATTIFSETEGVYSKERILECYHEVYADDGFVRIVGEGTFADTKHVVGTNFVDVGWVHDSRTGRLILSSAEDNLGKGASSQAVQSFNLMSGLSPKAGLLNF